MARGSESKKNIMSKILESFNGSFLYNDGKEIRIPMIENGEEVQIKCVLTAAKVNVEHGADNVIPGTGIAPKPIDNAPKPVRATEPTAEEKERLATLISKLF